VGEQSLSRSLSQNRDKESQICDLECISEDIEVSGCEDEEDNRSVCDAGSSGVIP